MRSKPRLLLVEDEPELLALVARMLTTAFVVDSASSIDEALAWVTAGSTYDCVLADLGLAGRSGLELHDLLPSELSARFVVMTGADHAEVRRVASRLGAHRVLLKPFSRADLLRCLLAVTEAPQAPRR